MAAPKDHVDRATLVVRARKLFDVFDKDSSGAIDAFELKQAMKELGFVMTDGEILDLLLTLGAKEDGNLDFGMFLQLCLNQAQIVDQRWKRVAETRDAFYAVGGGEDGQGSVDKDKIMSAVENFELDIDTGPLLKSLDANQDGAVSFEEFSEFLHIENEDVDTNLHREGNRWLRHNINDVMDMHATANLNLVMKERDFPRAATQRQVDGAEETAGGVEKDPFARLKWLDQLDRQFHAKLRSNRQKESEKRRKVLKNNPNKLGQRQQDPNAMPKSVAMDLAASSPKNTPPRTPQASAPSSPTAQASHRGRSSPASGSPLAPQSPAVSTPKERHKPPSALPSYLQEEVKQSVMKVMFPPAREASFRHAIDNPLPVSTRTPGGGSGRNSPKASGSSTPMRNAGSPRVAPVAEVAGE